MKKNIFLSLIILSCFMVCSCSDKKEDAKKNDTNKKSAYKIITLQQSSVGENIRLPGVLQPFEFVKIYPKVSGFIRSINVDRGSEVKAGQVLMQLDAPEILEHTSAARLKYMEARSNISVSRDKYARLLQTSKTPGTVSAYDLQAAYSKMMADSAIVQGELANYEAQKTMLSYLTITAPFDGIITERNIHPGALVGPGSEGDTKPMLVLQQQNKLRLVANIPEQYSAQVKDGEEVHYRINAMPGKEFTGKIARSSGSLSEHYRAETVEIDVPNPDLTVKGGMYAELSIPAAGSSNAFSVPKTAIVTTTERKYVVALKDNVTRYVDIALGNEADDSVEIFGDLKVGDRIIGNADESIPEGKEIGL